MRSCSATSGVAAAVDAAGVDAAAALSGVAPRVLVGLASGVEARESVEADAAGPTLEGKMHSMSQLRDQGVSWTEPRLFFSLQTTHVLQRWQGPGGPSQRLQACSESGSDLAGGAERATRVGHSLLRLVTFAACRLAPRESTGLARCASLA